MFCKFLNKICLFLVAEELLIIYETEAEQWATYLKTVFTGPISEAGICCYDIATVSSRRDDFLRLAQYNCKLLILSKGMLEGLCQMWRFFLARVLSPAANVVVLLCGVESLTPLLERVPLNGDECLVISSEQDAHVYLSTVTDIVKKDITGAQFGIFNVSSFIGGSTTAANVNPLTSISFFHKAPRTLATLLFTVLSLWQTSMDVFILLKNEASGSDAEVEFTAENQMLRLKPVHWNDQILCVKAPDFPAGNVRVTVYSDGAPLSMAQLQYYSSMEEISCLLSRVADPVDFMCQVQLLNGCLTFTECPLEAFRHCSVRTHLTEIHPADVPSLLHFAAQYGFKSVSSLLLQCPGAERALHTANRHGQTPTEIAKSHGHTELHTLLKETLVSVGLMGSGRRTKESRMYNGIVFFVFFPVYHYAGLLVHFLPLNIFPVLTGTPCRNPSTTDVQQEQQGGDEGEEVEDLYAPLGVNDEYDTILNSTKAVFIANRPPAPTPRPESTQVKEDKTPYIAQVFQKKKTPQGEADLYSLPTKQDSISSTYDTFVPNQIDGLQQLIELQQRVKAGSLTVDEALERFSDWQRVQKGMDAIQQEKLSQLRASIINNREDDDSVYGKYSSILDMWAKLCCHHREAPQSSDFLEL
uniref:B cell scaffold protein with ankyrin repeats 1 n=1 Tax=Seriola lalandi dorsalis TaxID=1841481 RepID=A0A3B4WUM7_SERLL